MNVKFSNGKEYDAKRCTVLRNETTHTPIYSLGNPAAIAHLVDYPIVSTVTAELELDQADIYQLVQNGNPILSFNNEEFHITSVVSSTATNSVKIEGTSHYVPHPYNPIATYAYYDPINNFVKQPTPIKKQGHPCTNIFKD